jgi:hypothetical protein
MMQASKRGAKSESGMSDSLRVCCPLAAPAPGAQSLGDPLDSLQGKTIGFIDNAKPNFHYLVDDLSAQLVGQFGVKAVRKHRKRGQVPVDPDVLRQLVAECDAIITGSGD